MTDSILDTYIKVTGNLELVLTDQYGNIKHKDAVKNLVVSTGRNIIAARLIGTGEAIPGWMEVGTDATAAAIGQTQLVAPVANSRTPLSTPTRSNNVISFSCTFGPGVGTGVLREAGIFNSATTSSTTAMLCRTVFNIISKDAGDTLTINWNLTIS